MNKQTVSVSLLIGIVLIGLFGCVDKSKQTGKKEKVSASVEATATSTQEWKTYVSKYGFSVSYPADWYLEEKKDIKLTQRELDGYISFTICDFNPDKPEESIKSKGIAIEYLFYDDAVSGINKKYSIPENKYEKILFLSDKHNIYKPDRKDKIERVEINGIEIVLIYYEGKYPWQAIFYLRGQDVVVVVATSEKGSNEFISILKTMKIGNER
jgi:hypothetical protein